MPQIESKKVYLVKLTRVINGSFVIRRFEYREEAFSYFIERKLATVNAKLEDKFDVEIIVQTL